MLKTHQISRIGMNAAGVGDAGTSRAQAVGRRTDRPGRLDWRRPSRFSTLAAAVLLAAALPAHADTDRGRLLYENHCRVCHDSNAHIRDNRRAGNRAEIAAWVGRWSQHLGLDWRAAEHEDVVDYLNQRYYGY